VAENLGICLICNVEPEDQLHAFFFCHQSMVAGHALLGHLQHAVPDLTPEAALRLEFGTDLNADEELATVYTLAAGLKYIWETRIEKKQLSLHRMRSELEAWVSILRRTRHRNSALLMLEMMQL
jgi:hypothetical protein